VNDGSDDGSEKICNEFAGRYLNIRTITLSTNSGKGMAIRAGIAMAKGDVFLICDADLELAVSDIPLLLAAMHESRLPLINGSRFISGSIHSLPFSLRFVANRLLSGFTTVLTGVKVTDVTCGYKLFTRELYHQLRLTERRFGFEAELLVKALINGQFQLVEIPVSYHPRTKKQGRKLRLRDGLRIIWVIVKIGLLRFP
jgi:glycosyltransferase involved in cell wall biosynthesis